MRNARTVAIHQKQRQTFVGFRGGRGAADHQALVGHAEIVNEQFGAIEHEIIAIGDRLRLDRLGQHSRILFGKGPGEDAFTRGHRRQDRLALLVAGVLGENRRCRHRAQQRQRRQRASYLLQHETEVGQRHLAAAILLGQRQPLPAQLGGLPPQIGRIALLVLFHFADQGGWALRFKKPPGGIPYHDFIFVQCRIHASSSAAGGAKRPVPATRGRVTSVAIFLACRGRGDKSGHA